MQALLPLSEALGILLNTKFKQVTNITSDKHSLYHAYSSWSYFVKSKLNSVGESIDYEIILNDKQYGIIFVLLDNLVEKSSTLKYQHSFQLLCDCFYNSDSINDFVFGLFIHILKKKPEDESATRTQQYKYSICRFITEFILEKEFDKEPQPKLLIENNDTILDRFGNDKLTKLIENLWIITRYESVTMDGRRFATILTSSSSDLLLILGYFLSQNQNEILFQQFESYFKLISELLHWFENQRELYTPSLKYLHGRLKEISSIVSIVNNLERSSREEDQTRSKEGRSMSLKSFSSFLIIYGFLMIENREYLEHYIKFTTKIEGSGNKHDYVFDYLMAILLELEKTENEAEILHNLVFLSALLGKMKKKELKKYLGMKVKGGKESKTLYEIIIHITNNKLFKINSDNIARITIYLYKEMVNYSGETNDRGFVDLVIEMLESDDIISKAVILFVSDIISNDKSQIYSIFKLVESDNEKAKKNGLLILSEIFNSTDIDEELSHTVTDYLINKLSSDDLSIRSCTATVFSRLDFKYIANRIIPLYVSKNEKERSSAHEILTKLMESNTENPNIFITVVHSIKDLPLLEDPNPDQTRKNIAERVMTFIPKYFAHLSPNSVRGLVEEIITTFFESNTNSLLVFMMNKILSFTLSVEAPQKILSTEDEYILNNKKDTLISILATVKERINSPKEEEETIFDMLAPLLVLKTLPVSIFYYMHPNEEHDKIFTDILQIMIRNVIDLSKPEELRRVSAEVASKLPPRITIATFVGRFANYLQKKDSLTKAKSILFCICQTIALYEEDPYLYSFITGEESLLIQSIKNAWNLQSNDQELSKIHQGCMDCMVMIIKYMLNYTHSDNTFISDNILKPLANNSESMMVRVSISNIVTKCSNVFALKHLLSLSSMVIPIYSRVLLANRESNSETSLFYCSSLQALMNLVFKIKTAVHPYSKSLLEIISKCLSDSDPNTRHFALKLLSALLFARDDVLVDHQTIFEFEILKKVKGMASIESSLEVQKLAHELCKIMDSLLKIKLQNKAKEQQDKAIQDRKKGILVLMMRHLFDNGYLDTAERMQSETGISLKKFDAADNMDLNNIVIEFEEYYQMKFMKKPKLFRKLQADVDDMPSNVPPSSKTAPSSSTTAGAKTSRVASGGSSSSDQKDKPSSTSKTAPSSSTRKTPTAITGAKTSAKENKDTKEENDKQNEGFDISGKKLDTTKQQPKQEKKEIATEDNDEDFYEERLLKPLPENLFFGDMRELAEMIRREIIVTNPLVHWDDISGLLYAKQMVKEAVVMPLKYPQFFTGLITPWKGALLFGPPGTGKTMLAKAVATECKTTFFNISASSIVSKWRGDSEKLVRVLFQLARHHAPSTIFLDELDSIMSQRVSATEHEGSRRMKTELLIQMDGLSKSNDLVFVLAASNLPWDLDQAVLRRLEKKILVGLPDKDSRKSIFKNCLTPERANLSETQYENLAEKTEGYSGSDITLACKESAMIPVRKIFSQLEKLDSKSTNAADKVVLDKVEMKDIEYSLNIIKPSGNQYEEQYNKWQQKFGI